MKKAKHNNILEAKRIVALAPLTVSALRDQASSSVK
jgi:hypothetical protein